ncbi:hypothetical protein OF117_04120 [Geodermatophilus sp. YIM 151500]|uniref:hypothetical protein n=1 Tax=Geodermatophilus sp. YIM 151500 TaxID=2984531 RepID=UPI0021E515C2|nr:hypothetical protein [Geodermatophilus sp. YIM 151500]MCV2488540.1 hypothetical protein [Geodermatophilus sp. YIM 151500]
MTLDDSATIIAAIVSGSITGSAAIVVGYLASSRRRQLKKDVQGRRLTAYEGLWAVTGTAAGVRARGDWAGGPLDKRERRELFDKMTEWYYGKSGGIFLAPKTRELYLAVKENLCCPEPKIRPAGALEEEMSGGDDSDRARGYLAIHQMSLLRWVMRFDLDIHTQPYNATLTEKQKELVEDSGIHLDKRPYKGNWTEGRARENAIGAAAAQPLVGPLRTGG